MTRVPFVVPSFLLSLAVALLLLSHVETFAGKPQDDPFGAQVDEQSDPQTSDSQTSDSDSEESLSSSDADNPFTDDELAAAASEGSRHSESANEKIHVYFGQAKAIAVDFAVANTKSANEAICTTETLTEAVAGAGAGEAAPGLPTRHVLLTGLSHGTTQVTIWSARHYVRPVTLKVEVVNDPDAHESTLEFIKVLHPNSDISITVSPTTATLIVSGTVKDANQASEVIDYIASVPASVAAAAEGGTSNIINRLKDENGDPVALNPTDPGLPPPTGDPSPPTGDPSSLPPPPGGEGTDPPTEDPEPSTPEDANSALPTEQPALEPAPE